MENKVNCGSDRNELEDQLDELKIKIENLTFENNRLQETIRQTKSEMDSSMSITSEQSSIVEGNLIPIFDTNF